MKYFVLFLLSVSIFLYFIFYNNLLSKHSVFFEHLIKEQEKQITYYFRLNEPQRVSFYIGFLGKKKDIGFNPENLPNFRGINEIPCELKLIIKKNKKIIYTEDIKMIDAAFVSAGKHHSIHGFSVGSPVALPKGDYELTLFNNTNCLDKYYKYEPKFFGRDHSDFVFPLLKHILRSLIYFFLVIQSFVNFILFVVSKRQSNEESRNIRV